MMAELIDRDALIEWLKKIPLKDLSDGLGLCRVIMEDDFKRAIHDMPKGCFVDAEPVRRGRWIEGLKCRECGQVDMSKPNYCPNCGAKMDGESDG